MHAELRMTRYSVLPMGILALIFLTCWLLLAIALLVAPGIQGDSLKCQQLDLLIRIFAAALLLVSLGGLVTFVSLLRYGLRLGELNAKDPGSLVRTLEAQRTFWRQAERLAWAVPCLLPLLIFILLI